MFIALWFSSGAVFGQQQPALSTPQSPQSAVATPQPQPEQLWYLRPEWVSAIITGVYVFISGFTLFAIKRQGNLMAAQAKMMSTQTDRMSRQADLMNRQTRISVESVRVAREAADAAKMSAETALKQNVLMEKQSRNATNKERARLSVQHQADAPFVVAGPAIQDVDGKMIVQLNAYVTVMNHGGTKAFGVKASGSIYAANINSLDSYKRQWEVPDVMDIDKGVTLSGTPFIKQEEWEGVEKGTSPLHVIGSILYNDIFGDPHETPFHFTWEVEDQGSWGKEGRWVTHNAVST